MTATIALKFFLEKCKIVPQEGLFFTFEVVWGSTTFGAVRQMEAFIFIC